MTIFTRPRGSDLLPPLLLGLLVTAFQSGCSASVNTGAQSPDGRVTRRDTRIQHEPCDLESAGTEKIDVNGDGRPDIYIVKSSGKEVCRAVDLNFDGHLDTWSYRDGAGQLRRRESDYDRDGRVDEISIYKGGALVEMYRATTLAGKLDTWQFYEGGKLVRAERDSDGDAVVDQWWEYPPTNKPGCPLIHSDLDGDGRPDPGATVDICKDAGYVPPERSEPREPTSPDFSRPGSLPTEVSSEPSGAGASGAPTSPPTDEKGSK